MREREETEVTTFNPGSTDNKPCDQILCTARDDVFKVHSELPDGSRHSVEGLVSGRLACPPCLGSGGARGAIHLDLLLQTFGSGPEDGTAAFRAVSNWDRIVLGGKELGGGGWGARLFLRLLSQTVGWEFRPCGQLEMSLPQCCHLLGRVLPVFVCLFHLESGDRNLGGDYMNLYMQCLPLVPGRLCPRFTY